MPGLRTCLLCRAVDQQANLVRARWEADAPQIGRGEGRGSWFHLACLGAHPRSLARLTRGQSVDALRAPLDAWYERQVCAALAEAWRCGGIVVGRRSVTGAGVVVLASDRRAPGWCDPSAAVLLPMSALALGGALGLGPRRAIGVRGTGAAASTLLALARAWPLLAPARHSASSR